jgi:FkbM family methyltransferase
MKHAFWVLANCYGRIFGRRRLAGFHHALIIFALHGLGYDNMWRPSFTGEDWFLANVLKRHKPRVCIDVGASVGNYSKALLHETQAEVYAFEPTPAAVRELKKLESNDRFHAVDKAVSNISGKTTFYLEGERSERNSLSKEGLFDPEPYEVTVITLDEFTKDLPAVDFIKIDTEGFEHEVLEGMQETLKRFRPAFVQFEFNILHLWKGQTLLSLSKLLPGYKLYRLLPRGVVPMQPMHFVDNVFMFSNVVAMRDDIQL